MSGVQSAEEKLAALQAAAREVVLAWKDPGAGGRSPYRSLIALETLLNGQGAGLAAAGRLT